MTHEEGEEDHQLRYKMNFNGEDIAGLDEVGRGCLFGPVLAGAVIISNVEGEYLLNKGLKDSKKLTAKQRKILVPLIKKKANFWSLGQSSAEEIDLLGIREATEIAMIRALQRLPKIPRIILVDGKLPLRAWTGQQITIVNGEDKSPAIAAASVIAKEERDLIIKRLSKKFPGYGLESHVGYGTKAHIKAIKQNGVLNLHRKSFLKKIINS